MARIKAFLHSGLNSMLWICLLCPLVSCAIFLEAGPLNKTVVEGDRVSLICDVNNDNDNTIFWTYLIEPGRRRYISSNGFVYPSTGYGVYPDNYEVIVDQSQQTYKLVILAINLSTEAGIYECGYEKGSGRRYTLLASAMITVSPFQQSVSCHQNRLSSLGSEVNQFEVSCSWTHSQPGAAYFDSSSGETIDVDLRFPDRIISRIESRDTPSILCRIMLDNDASVAINAPCVGDDTPGLVRVYPFISEVTLGSSASFVCTSGNQNYSPEISWNVSVNGSDPLDSQDRVIEINDVLSIVNVQDDDQDMLVECQVHISEDLVLSSYASLRIVEVTTPPSRRPPGDSQSNRTTDRTTTSNSIVEVTRPLPPSTSGSMVIALTVVMVFVIAIIALVIIIIFILVRRRKRRHLRRKYREGRVQTNDAIELRKIPHTQHDSSSQLYAVSFKDKKSKRHRNVGMDGEDADETHFKSSFSSSCDVLNMQPESTDEQIYAEADATTESGNQRQKNSRSLCNSMPILDTSEYETISDPAARSKQMAKTLSTLSVSSNRSSHGDRRWTSQRFKKDAPWTPPLSRHATSFRKPVNKDPNVGSDYTNMTIENNVSTASDVTKSPGRVPLYAKPDKKKKKSRNNDLPSTGNKANEVEYNVGSDYADIEDVGSRSQNTDDDELIDTYLGNIPSSFNSSLTKHMNNNKATSLNRSMSSRPGPPKPQRGKCQSMGMVTYQTVSDYEMMSNQVQQIIEDDDDYNELAQSEPSLRISNYDLPRKSTHVKTSHTLPRLSETATEAMMQKGYGREARRVKSLDHGEYELIGNEGGFRKNSTDSEVPPSPQYADIGETMNAYSSVLDCDVSASEWRQEDDNDYSDID